jgi:hypothetical protein
MILKIVHACMDWIQYCSVTSQGVHKRRVNFYHLHSYLASLSACTLRRSLRGQTGCGLKLAIYAQLVPKLRINGVVPLLYAVMKCAESTLLFTRLLASTEGPYTVELFKTVA